jgi:hypothetical protein
VTVPQSAGRSDFAILTPKHRFSPSDVDSFLLMRAKQSTFFLRKKLSASLAVCSGLPWDFRTSASRVRGAVSKSLPRASSLTAFIDSPQFHGVCWDM